MIIFILCLYRAGSGSTNWTRVSDCFSGAAGGVAADNNQVHVAAKPFSTCEKCDRLVFTGVKSIACLDRPYGPCEFVLLKRPTHDGARTLPAHTRTCLRMFVSSELHRPARG